MGVWFSERCVDVCNCVLYGWYDILFYMEFLLYFDGWMVFVVYYERNIWLLFCFVIVKVVWISSDYII